MTADLTKAIEEATHKNVDQFFDQWVYGAGAPKFEISSSYDREKKQVPFGKLRAGSHRAFGAIRNDKVRERSIGESHI